MKRYLLTTILSLSVSLVWAQTGHYWTESYGTRSMLLNGVVIGSVEDLGATFYNPARLAQLSSPSFVISGKAYEYKKVKITDGLGDGIDLNSSKFGGAPSLVSGTFKIKFLKNHYFAYSFLTRNKNDNRFTFAVHDFDDYVDVIPGDEYFGGEISVKSTMQDEWIGLSWAYPITEKFSVGVSAYYSGLDRSLALQHQRQAYQPDSAIVGMFLERRSYNYTSQSLLAKIGLNWAFEKITAGLTITTPKAHILGDGDLAYEKYLTGLNDIGVDSVMSIYIYDSQTGLPANSKSPWSIGAGTGIHIGKSIIHLSAEWFSPIKYHVILQSQPFTAQSTGQELQQEIVEDLKAVLNYGIGYEIYINESLSAFGSFATDFSAVNPDIARFADLQREASNTSFQADIYHLGFGTDFKTKFANLTLGATYAFSTEDIERNIEVDDGTGNTTQNGQIHYNRWLFILGFEFPFLDKAKAKLNVAED
jgi:hypothetical protein